MTTTIITCTCTVCNGLQAKVKGDGTRNGKRYSKTMLHNMVQMAHGPFARHPQQIANAPWAV